MTVLAVIGLSLAFGFLLFGAMVWLQFHDTRKGADGKTPEERIRQQDRRFKDRVRATTALWTKDIDKMSLVEQQAEEWNNRRRFDQ